MEVEGEKLEVKEASMMVWSRVRKRGQVEKNVSAVARGWVEFRDKFPYLGHELRRNWSEGRLGRLKGMDVEAQRPKLKKLG